MFYKNIGVCLVTINTPHTDVYDEKSYDSKGKLKEGEQPVGIHPGKSYGLKPAGAAVEIPDDVCKQKIVADQLKKYTISGNIAKVEDVSSYSAMGREDLEATAEAFGVKFDKKTTDEQLVSAIEAAESQ